MKATNPPPCFPHSPSRGAAGSRLILVRYIHPFNSSAMQDERERSEAGDPILRHEARSEEAPLAPGNADLIQAVSAHIERHIGPIEQVFHEVVSPAVHVDLYWIAPSRRWPHHIIITSGMSERPMKVPAEMAEWAYAELLVSLPASWPIGMEAFENEANYWPLRWLKILARLPHEHDTWLGYGHTVPNGDPPEPFAPSTELCSMIVLPPISYPEEFFELELAPGRTIHFWSLLPLYREEIALKLKKGTEALLERLDAADITDVIDPARPNVARTQGWWPF